MKKQVLSILIAGLAAGSVLADAYKDAYSAARKEEKARKYEVAAASYLSAAEIAAKPNDKADSYFRAGECYRIKKKYDKAIECFKKEVEVKELCADQ